MDDDLKKQVSEMLYQALELNESGEMDRLKSKIDDIGGLINPERISIHWAVKDVLSVVGGITEDEAAHVLGVVEHNHDCNNGITWDTLSITASMLYPNATDVEEDEEEDDELQPS